MDVPKELAELKALLADNQRAIGSHHRLVEYYKVMAAQEESAYSSYAKKALAQLKQQLAQLEEEETRLCHEAANHISVADLYQASLDVEAQLAEVSARLDEREQKLIEQVETLPQELLERRKDTTEIDYKIELLIEDIEEDFEEQYLKEQEFLFSLSKEKEDVLLTRRHVRRLKERQEDSKRLLQTIMSYQRKHVANQELVLPVTKETLVTEKEPDEKAQSEA